MLYSYRNEAVGDVHAHNEGLRVGETLRGGRGRTMGKGWACGGRDLAEVFKFFLPSDELGRREDGES